MVTDLAQALYTCIFSPETTAMMDSRYPVQFFQSQRSSGTRALEPLDLAGHLLDIYRATAVAYAVTAFLETKI